MKTLTSKKVRYYYYYYSRKVDKWVMQVKRLSEIALTQPHVAYSAFTHGLSYQWSYISRTVENISSMMQPFEEATRDYFIPAITGQQHCSQDVRDLLALPCRLGGLNLTNPTHTSDVEFKSSCRITAPLAALIIQQEQCHNVAVEAVQKEKSATKFEKQASQKQALVEIEANCPASMKRCVELASEKGASNWLSVLPVEEHVFHLSKGDFVMLYACAMVGCYQIYLQNVSVDLLSTLTMQWYVLKVAFRR